ncbi:MAG TPA: hypothetical protein PKV55_06085 [Nitrospira sp.]|jgi:hypothetical protein|nr:hypothetical protein [Nitrospira sp.]MBS0161559.1 hypothetical protein [Nitrospira sp.]MBS0176561.1 hypothetical protein [Nitrospira sp.]MCW5780936.1 hypothetical protein [Nitrospira sp.]HNA26360.1 hypothetical protein [Nitrospira sp.]
MSKPWVTGASTLLAVYEAVRERHVHERSCVDPRTGDFRRGWLEILAQLSPLEAAMLQDVAWWGPQMERRLTQLTDVRNVT